MTNLILMAVVTAYCACPHCCGKWAGGPTASGVMPTEGMTVAGPRAVPFGTVVEIEGVGRRQVQDRTAARFDDRFDVFFADHAAARRFGIRKAMVRIGNGETANVSCAKHLKQTGGGR